MPLKRPPAVQGAQSLDRAVQILRIVGDHDQTGAKPADVARRAGLKSPTAHRILRALESNALIERDAATGLYHLGPEIRVLGAIVSARYGIEQAAAPSLRLLAEETGDTALLSVRRGAQSFCLAREEGTYPIRSQVLVPGDAHPLGISSGGMAILAALPDAEVTEILAGNAAEIRDRFPNYSPDLLARQLADTRANGFAVNPGLIINHSVGVAVAITGPDGGCFGALTLAGIDSRMGEQRRPELARSLQREAARVYERLTNPVSTITKATAQRPGRR